MEVRNESNKNRKERKEVAAALEDEERRTNTQI
jgi:hypothetical protein